MKTIGYVSVALALAVGSAGLLSWRNQQPAPDRLRPRVAELDSSAVHVDQTARSAGEAQEIQALRQQVNRLNVDLQKLRNNVSDATGVPANAEPIVPLSREEEEQRWVDHVQQVDRAFRDEPLKDGWSREVTDEINAALSHDPLTAGLVRDVECRSSTCKLELAEGDPRRTERGIQQIIVKFSAELQNATIAHNGDLSAPKPTALYLAKARPEDSVPLVARR